MALVGLGLIKAEGGEYRSGDSMWQWYKLPFGQTVLAKRKVLLPKVSEDQIPETAVRPKSGHGTTAREPQVGQGALLFEERHNKMDEAPKQETWSIDRATDEAIKSNFDPLVVGTLLNRCLDETESIEQVIAFAAILGKARLARRRRRDRP